MHTPALHPSDSERRLSPQKRQAASSPPHPPELPTPSVMSYCTKTEAPTRPRATTARVCDALRGFLPEASLAGAEDFRLVWPLAWYSASSKLRRQSCWPLKLVNLLDGHDPRSPCPLDLLLLVVNRNGPHLVYGIGRRAELKPQRLQGHEGYESKGNM